MAKKVLMVEDFPVVEGLYKEALQKAGYEVEIARDGLAALEMVSKSEYDVILLDMLLPNINGIEFLEKFTKRPPHTKILALSDFTEPGRVHRAQELGVVKYLIKAENTPSELVDTVNSLFSDTKAEDQTA